MNLRIKKLGNPTRTHNFFSAKGGKPFYPSPELSEHVYERASGRDKVSIITVLVREIMPEPESK
jgi:hypothetical protein